MNKEKSKILENKMNSVLKNYLNCNTKRYLKDSQRGITLIALVITVIVMLILAGVAISVLVDGEGLFTKTRTAAEEYENATEEEAAQVSDWIAEIDEYLASTPSNPGEDEEEETPDTNQPMKTHLVYVIII